MNNTTHLRHPNTSAAIRAHIFIGNRAFYKQRGRLLTLDRRTQGSALKQNRDLDIISLKKPMLTGYFHVADRILTHRG
jgi:hypothetical protein